jgi:hypothetical protein
MSLARAPARGRALRSLGEGGFALLVTIVLVAFLVLILVGLASFTRVETQVAANNQHQAQARQNALMALNIAVGQLQKYAGPDQRVTARADLQNAPGQPNAHWTGVYGNAVESDYEDRPENIAVALSNTANLNANGSPARLLNWLVSGNERTAFDPRRGSGDVGAKGNITGSPASTISFLPGAALTGLSATTDATDTGIRIADTSGTARDARLLVGANSVTTSNNAGQPIDYVAAPAIAIEAPASTVPGMDPAGPDVTIGRYAWWVGDEGMKARVNLPLAGSDAALTSAERQEQLRNAFSNSPRAAIELMARNNETDWSITPPSDNKIDPLYTPSASLAKVTTLDQTPFTSSTAAGLKTALKYRFHDASAVSTSVLSDTYAGGLKRDLSILLDPSFNPTGSDSTANAKRLWVKHTNDGTDPARYNNNGFGIPTWQHLRSYAQTRIPTTGTDKYSLTARLPANDKSGYADDVGIGPVITYFSVGYRAALSAPPAPGVQIRMNLYPLVVIWNPYNFTLKAPPAEGDGSNYEAGVYPTYNLRVALEANVEGTWTSKASFNFQQSTVATPAGDKFIRFRLKCPDIPPGQSLIFSLPPTSSGDLYNQKNILENIEPEAGAYVSIPILNSGTPVTLQASDVVVLPGSPPITTTIEYRINEIVTTTTNPVTGVVTTSNASSSFKGGGGIHTYLGQPDDIAVIAAGGGTEAATRAAYNPSSSNRRWYNTHQEMDWSGLKVTAPFQEPGPLVYDPSTSEPAYVFQCQALFGGQGSNAQLNPNQYMFATRWIAQGNMRAVRSGRTRRDSNYNVLFTATAGQPFSESGFPWQKFHNGPGSMGNRTSAGQGHDWMGMPLAPVDVTLFEFPYANQPLQSIGQLQHANLSLVGAYPSYPVGNSLADFRLHGLPGSAFPIPQPAGWQLARVDRGSGNQGISKVGADMNGYYDISYLLNRTLWDRYYFSTVPATGIISPSDIFPNSRHLRYDTAIDVQNPDHSAAGLMLAGGFNINSTSEQAWRAVLGGGNQLTFDPESPDTSSENILQASFPRFTRPNADDDPNDAWKGYRTLDEQQIAQLARSIVTEIRTRGPFVSVADFVNRRLVDNPATNGADETFRGPVQAAIDSTTSSSISGQYPANDAATGTFWGSQDTLLPAATASFTNQSNQFGGTGTSYLGFYSQPQLEGSLNANTSAQRPYGNRSAFAPKYITQADILAKIGAGLTARSDTFTIRTYGETVNPATGDIIGRAWCEAVVQRVPEYVEDTVDAWATPTSGSDSQTFGRKFKIISFRWLSPSDI